MILKKNPKLKTNKSMSTKLFFYIAIRIIMLFSFGFLFSFIWDADGIHDFMGDTFYESRVEKFKEVEVKYDSDSKYNQLDALRYGHDFGCPEEAHYHWGNRHHWLTWCSVFLLLLSLVDAVISIRKAILKEYPNL